MEKQTRNSCIKSEESLIIQEDSCLRVKVEKLQICFLPENRSCNGIPKESIKFLANKGRVLASSNGLLLCRTVDPDKPTELFLCNPTTRTWVPIKLPSKKLAKSFQHNGDLKIAFLCGNPSGEKNSKFPLDCTLMFFTSHNLEDWNSGYDVYMLDNQEAKWILKQENLPTGNGNLSFDDQVFCKDGLYILSVSGFCSAHVFHYDIEQGTSRFLAMPPVCEAYENFGLYNCKFSLFGWERKEQNCWFESICLVKYFNGLITIWVLEDKMVQGKTRSSSWQLLLSIHIVEDLGFKDPSTWTNSFTILGKNLIFGDSEGYIYRYCLEGENYGKLDLICEYGHNSSLRLRFNSYCPSLRPCLFKGFDQISF